MKLRSHRIMALAATSFILVCASGVSSISAQEAEIEETPIETTISGEAIPEAAITIDNPAIEVEDLKLLVIPLTLEELQHEAAAWLFLLKDKTRKISNAEIAIKRENRKIEYEKQAIESLKDAKAQLLKAEKAQAKAERNNRGKEAAAEKVKNAKETLEKAEVAIEKITENHSELEGDETQQKLVQEAQAERAVVEAREILAKAKKVRQDITDDPTQSEKVTEKIDALEGSINTLEKEKKDLTGIIPDSPEHKEVKEKISQAREAVKNAASDLVKIMPGLEVHDDFSFSLTRKAIAQDALETETSDSDHLDESETHGSEHNLEKSEQEPEHHTEQELEHHTEDEAKIKNQLVVKVTNLQGEQTAIIDRFNVVLNELDSKGGESVSYRKYMDAISGINVDVTDIEGVGVRLASWLKSKEGGIRWGTNLAKFLGILLASAIAARLLANSANRILSRIGGISSLFRDFVVMVIERSTLVIGVLFALTSLGVSLGPVVALLGGASFVLAFALQSNLGNFASGLMLLINKPFDVGDEIKVADYWAYVDSISLASTKLKDFSGNIITLPNNTVWGGEIINYTHADTRKIGLAIHVKFQQDLDQIHDMWMEITAAHPKVLDDPGPSFFPWNGHYDYYIYINLTAWSKTDDYWSVYVDLLKELQKRIQELNIELAAPQQEINLKQLLPEAIATQIQKTNDVEPKLSELNK